MPAELENEREIVRRCQEGDLRAFETVYHHFHPSLLGFALRMLGRREDAEDAVQAAFVKLYRSIGRFRFDARFSTYLMRILIHACYDIAEVRKKHRMQRLEIPESVRHSSDDLRLELEEAIGRLPGRMRECFVLFAVEGFPQKEIARMLDLSVGTVKAHIFQAKGKLRTLLSDPPAEEET